jgi:cob(I)alamin adenosyltransferase
MQKIYTGRGDDGYTSLIGGARVAKYDDRPEAYGTLDEASAALGLARATATTAEVRDAILEMQRALYRLMAELATVEGKTSAYAMTAADVARVEALTNDFTARVPVQREFVVPGDTPAGATLDLARTVVRRGERLATRLVHDGHVTNPHVLGFLNRLSSLCFILGRYEDTRHTGHTSTAAKERAIDSGRIRRDDA